MGNGQYFSATSSLIYGILGRHLIFDGVAQCANISRCEIVMSYWFPVG